MAYLLLLLLQDHDGDQNNKDNLTVTQAGKTISSLNRKTHTLPVFPLLDMDKYNKWVSQLDRKTYKEPINARIGENEQTAPGQNGLRLNRSKFLKRYYEYLYSNGPASVEVPMYPVFPKVDAELLASLRSKQIGYYVTYFNSNNKDRSHNITLAAKAMDSAVVFPGETFSFNRVIGIRTTGNGYRRAGVIVRGELSEGVGGGICQVSSTLFNAVDRAGLEIVKRYSHSRHVPYVPPGRDATVSWGGPDFVFENAYNQPVLIRAFVGGGSMSVAIYSSDVIEFAPRRVPSMSNQLPEEIDDSTPTPANGKE
ncbi:VanW family protein [Paenibacillus sp.]|jgi:vancomycin resistance protein YoaR|uniref:VanW family protein n=1 Tax=Paenibacillus sp. TaxID=58172 RepID=UPI00281DE025|nr:VanW family protein [Paenibacillus sp.]MDR0271187.1 VanW family protein [Paenibacillus sp.]